MTQAHRSTVSEAIESITKVVTLIGGLLVICGALWAVTAWATGGLKPQTQVASDALSEKVTNIQSDITDIKKRLDVLPNSYEVADQRQHFSRIDNDVAAVKQASSDIGARVTSLEQARTDFGSRLTTLERLQWRQPH